jgi:hypothetical protein
MGFFESVGTAIGTRQAQKRLGYRPYGTKELDKLRLQDIRQLHGENAFKGPGLGYSEDEMQAGIAGPRDYLAGERAAEEQRTADQFRSPGGFGLNSGAYVRTLQGIRLNRQNQLAEAAREMTLENARQARADAMARLAAVTGNFELNTGLVNQRQAQKRSLLLQHGAAAGRATDEGFQAAYGGGLGG